jgi:hypothetical protein
MQIIKCWDIQVWDGGERTNHKYYVSTEEAALQWKKMHKHDTIYEREFVILESFEEITEYDNGELRRRALAKLTDAERKVLGF